MRFLYSVLSILVLVAFGISLWLIPNKHEEAAMLFRGKEYAAAQIIYEEKLKIDKNDLATNASLVRLYLASGEPEAAVDLLEKYVEKHPTKLDAQKLLSSIYSDAKMPIKQLALLEQLAKTTDDFEVMHRLWRLYYENEMYPAEKAILERLVVDDQAQAFHLRRLAFLQGFAHQYEKALSSLSMLQKRYLKEFTIEDLEFSLAFLERLFKEKKDFSEEEISKRVKAYIKHNEHPSHVAQVIYLLQTQKRIALAMEILEPYSLSIEEYPDLYASYVGLQLERNDYQKALALLNKLHGRKKLPQALKPQYVALLLHERQSQDLAEVLADSSLENWPQSVILDLYGYALKSQAPEILAKLKADFGKEHLRHFPSQAYLHNIVFKEAAAQSVAKIASLSSLEAEQLLNILVSANLYQYAKPLVAKLNPEDQLHEAPLINLCTLYQHVGQEKKALEIISKAYVKRPSAAIERAWLLAELKARNEEKVLAWVKKEKTSSEELLQDLFYTAYRNQQAKLALYVSNKLFEQKKDNASRILLAKAYVINGDIKKALAYYQESGADSLDDGYIEILTAAVAVDFAYAKELKPLLLSKLSKENSPTKKRQIAFTFLEKLNDKEQAAKVFWSLAQNGGPETKDLAQLLYLYGPRVPKELSTWLKAKASKAQGNELSAWLGHLLHTGDVDFACNLIEDRIKQVTSPVIVDCLNELVLKADDDKLQKLLQLAVANESSTKQLVRYAHFAKMRKLKDVLELSFAKVDQSVELSKDSILELALIAYELEKDKDAERLFRTYFEGEAECLGCKENYLAHFFYGNMLSKDAKLGPANEHYRQALALIEEAGADSFETREVKAQLFVHLEQRDEAINLYKKLVEEKPQKKNIRADLANLLIDKGRLDEAKTILAIK